MASSTRWASGPTEGWPRLILAAAPNAMLLVDPTGRITLANRAAETLFGYAGTEMVGAPLEMLIPEGARKHHASLVREFAAESAPRRMGSGRKIHGRRQDGREVPIEIELHPIDSSEGRFTLASITDLTERDEADQRFRLVVEAAPNAMVMVDPAGRIALVNRNAEQMFGYGREELVGQKVEVLIPEAARTAHTHHVEGFFADPAPRPMGHGRELYGRRKDASQVPVEIGLNPITTAEGQFTLASIIDITQRKRSADELRRSNADLEQFAYVASHDLQEPLRMVASYTELLGDRYRGQLDTQADKYTHYAVDGAKRMQRLVADLLAYSRVGSQGRPFAPVDLETVLARVLHTLRQPIRSAGAKVVLEQLPVVLADEGQIQQLFQNLIGNAVKFRSTAPLGIWISAAPQGDKWVLRVRDTGIGMDMAYAERVFQMFQRLHERSRYEGSGIGLAITKRIVERHGGRIWLESTLGEGTTVSFTLPRAPTTKVT